MMGGVIRSKSNVPRRVQGFQGDQVVDVHDGVDPVEVFPLRDPPHEGFVRSSVAGRIVPQGPVRIPKGFDRRELAGLLHGHASEPGYSSLNLLPKRLVVFRIAHAGGDPAYGDAGDLSLELGCDGEVDHFRLALNVTRQPKNDAVQNK
jgi:hypothetical protein